jgi:hypothetical protein
MIDGELITNGDRPGRVRGTNGLTRWADPIHLPDATTPEPTGRPARPPGAGSHTNHRALTTRRVLLVN